jgi:hypothetical protein
MDASTLPAGSKAYPASGWAGSPREAKIAGAVVLGAAGVAAVALLADLLVEPGQPERNRHLLPRRRPAGDAAKGLHGAAALLSASVLADSAVEHYRGGFDNPGMYTPLVVSSLALAAGVDGAVAQCLPRRLRDGVYGLAGAVGGIGVGFHVYNVLRRPGGLNWLNAFYAAPIGAPAALSLAGAVGLAADDISENPAPGRRRWFGLAVGRALSALTAFGLMGTVGEAGLLHFRGSFQNPFMYLPVSLPPVAAALMGKAAVEPERPRSRPLTRAWLLLTSVMGVAGVGFHAFGVSRAMGGWRNWTQNVVDGPPLPAPPSFSALAIAAWAALRLRDIEDG